MTDILATANRIESHVNVINSALTPAASIDESLKLVTDEVSSIDESAKQIDASVSNREAIPAIESFLDVLNGSGLNGFDPVLGRLTPDECSSCERC